MSIPRPENIGDIYKATGYPFDEAVSYGAVYSGPDPTRKDRWIWFIEMDDGDIYEWLGNMAQPDMMGATLELVRRNPLPKREVPS